MHHEVFLALLGVAGDVVEARADGLYVREDARFLSKPQRAMIDRVLRLGHAFSRLQRFVRAARDRQGGSGDAAEAWPSLYVRAMAQGVERMLDQYADAVARLEAKVLATGVVFPIPSMMFELADYAEVLPELTTFLGMLEAAAKGSSQTESVACNSMGGDAVGGAVLLGALHKKSGSGFPRIRECFQQLLFSCHCILYKQMLAWMLYGEILDPFDEFFIKRKANKSADGPDATLQRKEARHSSSNALSDALLWQRQFSMDLNAVPTLYFPPAVAEKVFFVGKAVHILSLSSEFAPTDAHEIARIMSEVAQRREFDALALEQAVERIRVEIARRLHDLVVVRSGFARFLETLKDFFFLTRGEIFHAFIERSFPLMLQKPTSKSEDDINYGIWQPTIREFTPNLGNNDGDDQASAWVQRFRLKLPLQTFVLRGFTASDDLVLAGLTRSGRNGKSLSVAPTINSAANSSSSLPGVAEAAGHALPDSLRDDGALCGAAWWRHVQLDASALVSEFSVQFQHREASRDNGSGDASRALDPYGGRPYRVALLLRNDNGMGCPLLHNGAFSIAQSVGAAYVAIQLDIETLAAPDSIEMTPSAPTDAAPVARVSRVRVVCKVTPSRGGDKDVRVSLPVEISVDDSARSMSASDLLNCRVEYARQEVRAPAGGSATPHVMYKKMIAVFVNDTLVLQSPLDLQDALRLSASNNEYWVGLAMSEGVSVATWSLDKFASRATVTCDNTGNGKHQRLSERNEPLAARELWRSLSLDCDIPWPLQLLVPSDLLRSYSHVFQFCFRLKRVAYALERAWKCDALRASASAGALRGRMSFVVRNLELHFHVSVIESRFSQCAAQLAAATDFDRVKRIHEAFVASVVKGCYVHTKTVTAAIDEVLGVCWQFAEYVLYQESLAVGVASDSSPSPLSPDRVAVLADEFHRRFEFLNGVLQIAEARELLFLLEFNDFFADERERRKRQVGLRMTS